MYTQSSNHFISIYLIQVKSLKLIVAIICGFSGIILAAATSLAQQYR